jgi:multidrug efflux pump subunit AcrA (membrane-fusion protein)
MLKIIIPIIFLVGAALFAKYLIDTGPEAKKKPFVQRLPVVEVVTLKPDNYTVNIEASGTVKAGTQTNLVAEVSGRILNISDNFQEGNYFDKDQVLLEIDQANYLNAVEIANSDVEANKASLKQINAEEQSNKRSIKLAKQNLALGKKELARVKTLLQKKLISRSLVDAEEQKINQLEQKLQELEGIASSFSSRSNAIKAKINSTLARLKQESLNLSRTIVKSPYTGRVLKKNVDFGQYVSVGTVLGEIYATDYVNVELPLSLNQYELLGMPEAFRNKKIKHNEFPEVTLTNPNSLREDSWKGRVVRSSAALDEDSRQINVIVRVDNPYDAREGISTPIRIGQFLRANIKGKTFKNVFVLPPVAVLFNREIRVLKDGKINIIPIKVLWNSATETVVEANPEIIGEKLVTTNLNQAIDGMQAISLEEQQKQLNDKVKNNNRAKAKRVDKQITSTLKPATDNGKKVQEN